MKLMNVGSEENRKSRGFTRAPEFEGNPGKWGP